MGEVLKRRIIARGKHLMLACSENWEYVERLYSNGVVVVAATTDENELILTEQYRIPLQANVIEDCKTPNYKFEFGLLKGANTRIVSNDLIKKMPNGQEIGCHYYINLPVYFNRFYGEYNGDYLLIGGGKKCGCGDPQNRHPQNKFFHLDVDNHNLPDLAANAGYEGHLRALPNAKFSFIWFEHCTIPALMDKNDNRVINQYFRMLKPGGIILFQSNLLVPDCIHNDNLEKAYQSLVENFASYNFAILENKNIIVRRKNEEQHYRQIILMKPFPRLYEEDMMNPEPSIRINIENCIIPKKDIQELGLFRAHVLAHQEATPPANFSWTELFKLFPLNK